MNRFTHKLFKVFQAFTIVLTLCLPITAAADDDGSAAILQQIKLLIQNIALYSGINLEAPPPSFSTPQINSTNTIDGAIQQLLQTMTTVSAGSSYTLTTLDSMNADMLKLDALRAYLASVNSNQRASNLDVLLGPLTYQPIPPDQQSQFNSAFYSQNQKPQNQSDLALQFIQSLTQQQLPLTLPDPSTYANASDDDKKKYIASLQSYSSLVNIGVNNLKEMYADRLPQPNSDANLANKSPLQIATEMATRRLTPEWHNEMEHASSLAVQRETLYVLAEMNAQLLQARLRDERLLATVSVMQMQLI
ncbi:MAG: hypothetical protein JSS53_09985, partial [Proteobacteria bacterium]|nr:hypothetical protein [Pseudomonadota bacterium]